MKINYLSTLGIVLLTSNLILGQKTAQNLGQSIPEKVWHTEEKSRGATIFAEDFGNGIPSTWTNTTITGPVSWKHTTVGHMGAYPTAALNSETSYNGWVIVDSDADNFSGGGQEDAMLTTPVINCSGYSPVKVEFQQMFRRWQSDITTVRVTTDGGVTYTDFVINANITQAGTDNPDYVNIDITNAIAANPSNVQITFWWQGVWDYGWQIDDFTVKEVDANDIIIKRPSFSSTVSYYQIPQSQIKPMQFHAFAENIGYNAQTNVQLNVSVANTSTVFNGSSNTLTNLAIGATDSLGIIASFTPSITGVHHVNFDISQTETDDDYSNNVRNTQFFITDSVYAIDNGIYGGQWWNQGSSSGANSYEIGAIYEIESATKTGTASVYIGNNSVVGSAFVLNLYEDDGTTFNIITSSDIYDVTNDNLGTWVTIPWTQYANLNAGAEYLVSLQCFGGADEVYVGYSTNTSFRGSTLSNDGLGGSWSVQPRTPMIRLNLNQTLNTKQNNLSNIGINIYPNPSNDNATIEIVTPSNDQITLTIHDISGKILTVQNIGALSTGNHQITCNTNNFEAGIYFVTIKGQNTSQTATFIKN